MNNKNIYPVWKPYNPKVDAVGALILGPGTYRFVNGQWERLELGTCQEFINQVHERRKRENLPTRTFQQPIAWNTRPLIDEDTDG